MLLLAFAKLTMKIKGVWEAYTDDFVVRYNGEKRVGAIRYGNKIDKKGRLSALFGMTKTLMASVTEAKALSLHTKPTLIMSALNLTIIREKTG